DTSLKPTDMIPCFQYRMTGIDIDPDNTHFYIGSAAPGGYVWVFPKTEDSANVGIGMLYDRVKKPGEVKEYLDRWIASMPGLAKGQAVEMVAGGVSVCPPPDVVSTHGLMLVGDAARMTDAITGGGISQACIAAKEAGEVAALAVESGDASAEFLQQYEKRWRRLLENSLYRDWMAKEKMVKLSDDDLNKIISTLAEVGVKDVTVSAILEALQAKHPDIVAEFMDLL
ncbi:MAG: NAD(P)/FAD-dependent oxidoreductase, partial [Thermoplasmata archaeon]|nr:NAD(P)/FAD-dependent oxidoreductase [Thermoplasmata archaeon]